MSRFHEEISEYVWQMKYRNNHENSIEKTWKRIAKAVAHAEKKESRAEWQKNFYDILEDFSFLPGGRIIAGAGLKKQVTLFNCFVMPIVEDSLHGIFDALKEAALTLQQGGGGGI